MDLSFFRLDGESLVPGDMAVSSWSDDQLHGVAISGALARAAEQTIDAAGRSELVPVRMTVDLFRPTRRAPCRFETTVVREGPRLCLLDVHLLQDDTTTARASVLFLRTGEPATGEVWMPDDAPQPPPLEVAPVSDEPHVPFLRSDADWSQDFRAHQNAGRKTTWNTPPAIVSGEPLTGFQAVAAMADGTSLTSNWGSAGVEHINADITLTLARRPAGVTVGLHAADRVEHEGISVGTATVFDREGRLGTTVVTAMTNTRRSVDLGSETRAQTDV
ncbi:hypothetical protein I601_1066 [Nocardioides dokdonensis FR1436]|uniref:Thioesterase superfamily protein n=1 Tax=Nocardioides dokdonensis FR1436 TaxID=1300347 RepID=A0A1A9GGU6_9ACTN|nr:thioesterase family protein [Nocardioides dokdonensis]ANH37508.1 hypothetical protein I601_1066 [Nocardioides dokdonensis FR1436]